ncbi:MAG: metallophosphoesterase, partial [Bacteroidales bacterium]|nr:metallophosphoesterase [Bacteroidales bacterium]
QPEKSEKKTLKFVSFPDFFNFDIPHPWPGYDTAIHYFLDHVKAEEPAFVMIAGDLVNGHWWNSPQCVEHMGTIYYSGWVRRMQEHGLKYYTAVGDHELGDDPWPPEKVKLIPALEKVYSEQLDMPGNGPENKKGLAYYVRRDNLLMITVETFEVIDDSLHVDVTGEQLKWFTEVLNANRDATFKIVQGHVPVWGEVKSRSSSRLMLNNGKESAFYKTMKEYDVDIYLAGEFHDVTVLESDGIWQIVHGSSWGRKIVNTEDYLVGEIVGDELILTMKRIYMDAEGEYMWNLNKDRGPRETVRISEKTLKEGPEITGTLTIRKTEGQKQFMNRTGIFRN